MSLENVIKFESILSLPDGDTYFNRFQFIESVMNSKNYVDYYSKKISDDQLMEVMSLLSTELVASNIDDAKRIAKIALAMDAYLIGVDFIWAIHQHKYTASHILLIS